MQLKAQRLRIGFGRGPEQKYLSHLDMMRLWARALRRASLPTATSDDQGLFPRVSIAAPLPVGVTSEAELVDVFLRRRVSPFFLMQAISTHLPRGITVRQVEEVGLNTPSLQSLVRAAEYRVAIGADWPLERVQEAIQRLLDQPSLIWERPRETEVRRYDLRATVDRLWVLSWRDEERVLGMQLRIDSGGAGRPDDVVAALGFPEPALSIHRVRIELAEPPRIVPAARHPAPLARGPRRPSVREPRFRREL